MIDDSREFEAELRGAAPALPPGLRSQTLQRCAVEVHTLKKRQRNQLGLLWAAFGVCIIQWMVASRLDTQTNVLIAGSTTEAARLAQTSQRSDFDLRAVIAARSRRLATWMVDPENWKPAG